MFSLTSAFVPVIPHVSALPASSFISNRTPSLARPLFPVKRRRSSPVNPTTEMVADEKPEEPSQRNDGRANSGMFGIRLQTNGDVIKFGIAAIAIVYALKAVLTTLGTPDILAGQIVTGFVSVASLLIWVSTYVFRVGTKGMTYAQQLRDYEDEVIKKRYEELTEDELAALSEELSDDI